MIDIARRKLGRIINRGVVDIRVRDFIVPFHGY
jgi:hypothetical protein